VKLKQLQRLRQNLLNRLMENKKNTFLKDPPKKRGIFYLLTLLMLLISSVVFSQAEIKFTVTKKKFEEVTKGDVVRLEYPFTNTGDQPLIITDYKVECSCTSAEFPKQPIAPGQSDKIIVQFNTKTTYEWQDRIVEIVSNAKNSPAKIRFKGNVKILKN
jgi:hypothetical protein